MKSKAFLILLLTLYLREITEAWTLGVKLQGAINRRKSLLRAQDENHSTFGRLRLQDVFANYDDIHPLDDSTASLQSLPVNEWIESSSDIYSDWLDTSPCYGEECEVSRIIFNVPCSPDRNGFLNHILL